MAIRYVLSVHRAYAMRMSFNSSSLVFIVTDAVTTMDDRPEDRSTGRVLPLCGGEQAGRTVSARRKGDHSISEQFWISITSSIATQIC